VTKHANTRDMQSSFLFLHISYNVWSNFLFFLRSNVWSIINSWLGVFEMNHNDGIHHFLHSDD